MNPLTPRSDMPRLTCTARANLLASLGRHAEAVADWDRVVEYNDEPADRVAYRLLHILCLVRTANYERGVAEANDLAAAQSRSNPLAAADFYNFACAFALASTKAAHDERLASADRQRRSTSLADAAIGWLNRAAGLGFFADAKNREHARTDVDLVPLRERADFIKLVGGRSP